MSLITIIQGSYKNPAEMDEKIDEFWRDLKVTEESFNEVKESVFKDFA